ncbi:sarcosine oxidase subunit beta [Cohaesibacter sp. ES.047]|uniref:NAD(P)/FAD-dependent oxidoreductase n=1 Tax=Cohaesibacter sp. ES.047 TaxID=1798205 RepID=UPI000BB836BD|nr:FAD-binding oxidoreductase [Cohaesibacter sp. ES.047]SNY90194.1 sarcosine oxidase subunit beta [Cohaesibacter sp. ES.047]
MSERPPFHPDVIVVGAGITGLSAAVELAESGVRTRLIDAYGPAAMASGWTLAGVRQSGRDPAELPMAKKAVEIWQTLHEKLGAETGYRQEGNLRLARTEAEVVAIRTLVKQQSDIGLDLRFLDNLEDIRAIAPPLSDTVLAASYCPTDGHADPLMVAEAYLSRAKALGVEIIFGERVTALTVSQGKVTGLVTDAGSHAAGAVLLATGFLSNRLLEPLGTTIPLRQPMVTVIQTAPAEPQLCPVLGVANADMAARQELSGRFRVTSGMETWPGTLVEENGKPAIRPYARAIEATISKVATVLPVLHDLEIEKIWAGALDLTPDALPVIDVAQGFDNLMIAAGFSGHGFGIGPVTGPLAAQKLIGKKPDLDIDAFRLDRFDSLTGAEATLTLHG